MADENYGAVLGGHNASYEVIEVGGERFVSLADSSAILHRDYHSLLSLVQRDGSLVRNPVPGAKPKWLLRLADVERLLARRQRTAVVENGPRAPAPRG